MDITTKLRAVLKLSAHQRERLASALTVSASTIDRWAAGAVAPSPKHTQALLEALAEYNDPVAQSRVTDALVQGLRDAREVMHRHGAASSRNDALDQISLLLMVHLHKRRTGTEGLQEVAGVSLPETLVEAVRELQTHTPADVHSRFMQSAKNLAHKPIYLCELVNSLSRALSQIDATEDWRRPHEFHEVFVNFLSSAFHEEKEFAQYMTPREVVDFMVRVGISLVNSIEYPKVLDPSCGTAAFLTSFAEIFAEKLELRSGAALKNGWWKDHANSNLVGVDTSERMIRLASASFIAAGLDPKNVFLDSSLEPTTREVCAALAPTSFDLILTNPPFGAEHSRGQHGGGRVPSELLYIERYLEWLKPGGVVLTIVPDSVLTNRGVFAEARASIIQGAAVVAVVSLPPVTFAASGTTTKTSILVLRKSDGSKAAPTFFAVASHVGFDVSTRGSVRKRISNGRNDLSAIADAILFQNGDEQIGVISDIDATLDRWDAQFQNSPLARGALSESVAGERIFINSVADLVKDRADPRSVGGDMFDYIEISNVDGALMRVSASATPVVGAPSRARRLVKSGDVLISTVRPERRTVGVVPPELDGAICSTGFAVLRPHSISPYVLAAALKSDLVTAQLVGVSSGVAYPAFDAEALRTVEIDLKTAEWQQKCVEYGRALEALEVLRSDAEIT